MRVFDLLLTTLLVTQFAFGWLPMASGATTQATKVSRVLGDDLTAFISDSGEITVKDKGGRGQSSRNVLSGTVVSKVVDESGRAFIKCFLTGGDKLADFSGDMKDAPTKLKLKNNQVVSGKVLSCDASGITLSDVGGEVPHTKTSTRWENVEKVSSPQWAYILALCPERLANGSGTSQPMSVKVIFAGCGDIYKSADLKVALANEKGESQVIRNHDAGAEANRKIMEAGKFIWPDPSLKHENALFTSTKACDSADTIKANFVKAKFVVPAGYISAEDLEKLGEFTPQKVREGIAKGNTIRTPKGPPNDPKDVEMKKPPEPLKDSPDPNSGNKVPPLPDPNDPSPGPYLGGSRNTVPEIQKPPEPLKDSLDPNLGNKVPPLPDPNDPSPGPYLGGSRSTVPTGGIVHNDGCPPPYNGPDVEEGKQPKPPLKDSPIPNPGTPYVHDGVKTHTFIGSPDGISFYLSQLDKLDVEEEKKPKEPFVHNDGCPPGFDPGEVEEGKKPKPPLKDSVLPKNSYVPKTGIPEDKVPPPQDPITQVILEVPISYLVDGTEPVIGAWTTAPLRQGRLIEEKVKDEEKPASKNTELLSSAAIPGSPYRFSPLTKFSPSLAGDDSASCVAQMYFFTNGSVAGFTNKFSGETTWYTPDGKQPAAAELLYLPSAPTTPALPLEEAQKSGLCEVAIRSDNDPNHCEVVVTSKAGTFTAQIAEKACFLSSNPANAQNLMEATDPIFTVPAGKTVVVPIETYCISTKSISPPPPAGLKYIAGKYPDTGIYTTLVRISQNAQKLNQEGRFNDVPVTPARRARKIAQTAIWMYLGKRSGKKDDFVSVESLKHDLLNSGQVSPQKLSPEQLKRVELFAQLIFTAAEKTVKEATTGK